MRVGLAYPWKSMVLMMKPNVGLTVFTSSPMTFFTIVVLPALSRPLPIGSACCVTGSSAWDLQHQNPHLLVFQPGFAEYGKHVEFLTQKAMCLQRSYHDHDGEDPSNAADRRRCRVLLLRHQHCVCALEAQERQTLLSADPVS
jgi:hypothetical protein